MKSTKVLLNILSVVCFIFCAIYTFTLVFIPIAVYCFGIGRAFSYKAENMYDSYCLDKKSMKRKMIFVSIFCFPFGLLSIIVYNNLFGNNVSINHEETTINVSTEPQPDFSNDTQSETSAEKVHEESEEKEESEEEKYEKLAKLKNFMEKGIITEDEYEMAREQMFGKKD